MLKSPFVVNNKKQLIVTALVLLLLLGVWLFITLTKIGITPDVAFWNEAGVPLLGLQVLVALAVSFGLGRLLSLPRVASHPFAGKALGKILVLDILLAALVYALAAGVWMAEPQRQSFNAPRPSPPTYEFYPLSDSTSYDLGAQYALIGQGINNDLSSDKPLYHFLLALFHLVGGQSVRDTINVQILFLALFPVVLYLLGKDIHSRGLGLFVALLAIFKERNAIAAALDIQVSHAKLMMTEVPTALFVATIALLLFNLERTRPPRAFSTPLWIGLLIGAATLLRTNAFLFLPLAFLLPLLWRAQPWRQRLVPALSVILGFSLFILPWLLTNRGPDGRLFIQGKLDAIFQRYQQFLPGGSGLNLSTPHVASLSENIRVHPRAKRPRPILDEGATPLQFIPAHFLHNQIASVFVLPSTVKFRSLEQTVSSPIWEKNWDGTLSAENKIMLPLNLVLLAVGLASAFRRWRGAGLVPAMVEIVYFLSNALARTSGSRYLVPADWIVYFYYAIGLFQLLEWLWELAKRSSAESALEAEARQPVEMKRWGWAVPVSAALVLGLLLPLPSYVVPQRYPTLKKTEAWKIFREQVSLKELGFKQKDIVDFVRHSDSFVFQARLLYPRYFFADDGLCETCYVFDAAFGYRSYPRLTFVALGPVSAGVIVEMPELPANFRGLDLGAAPDVWVVGCRDDEDEAFGMFGRFEPSVRALVIAIQDQGGLRTYAPPGQKLSCD
ncbi:MAG: glycosyltransferase family 39 protein [Chloroflexi bacterium]|nr:glycosyltransferase family 39 protein [Chloroflexota bacterium]